MDTVRYEVRDQVATLTLNQPETRNALSQRMRSEVAEVVGKVRRDREVRALVIEGAGGHFCSGGDLRAMAGLDLDAQGWRLRMHDLHHWLRDLLTLDRPVIAAVDGAAYGAGFGLALAADLVIASTRARFCLSFMRVGLVPDLGTFHTLPRVVGVQRARELMLSAREVGAEEALRLGVAMELQPPEALAARAQAVAASFVQASPVVVSAVKRALASADDLDTRLSFEAECQAIAAGTQVHREAVQDFLARRPPKFQWPA